MLTAYAEPDLLFAAMQVGAAGYLLKHTPAAELVATLRRIAGGEHVLNPDGRVAHAARVPRPPGVVRAASRSRRCRDARRRS